MPSAPNTDPTQRRATWSDRLWLVLAALLLGLGAFYRVRDFSQLLLVGDERHALRAAYKNNLIQCFTHYQAGDSGIPLNLYARLLLVTGQLDELTMRLPMIVAGLALLASPLLFVRRLGRPVTLIALALFAISPGLVYFTFVARPYALTMCMLTLSFWAWDRWFRNGGRRDLLLFAVCAGLAVFFHIFAAFGVAALFAVSLLAVRREPSRWREWVSAAAITGAIVLVLLGPGVPNMLATKKSMVAGSQAHLGYTVEVWNVLTGFVLGAAGVLFLGLAAGIATWWRRELHMGLAGLGFFLAQTGALIVLRPDAGSMAYFRWFLPVWPILLIFTASGLESLAYGLSRALQQRSFAVVGALAAMISFALIPSPETGWSQPLLSALHTVTSPFVSWCALLVYASAVVRWQIDARTRRRTMRPGSPAAPAAQAVGQLFAVAFATAYLLHTPIRLFHLRVDTFRAQRRSLVEDPFPPTSPPLYRRLASDPSTGDTILETPLPYNMGTWVPHSVYQSSHGKRVLFVDAQDRPEDHYSKGFRNVLPMHDTAALRRSGARYLVLHLDVASEYAFYGVEHLLDDRTAGQYDRLAAKASAYLRKRCGEPVVRGPRFELFDLSGWLRADP